MMCELCILLVCIGVYVCVSVQVCEREHAYVSVPFAYTADAILCYSVNKHTTMSCVWRKRKHTAIGSACLHTLAFTCSLALYTNTDFPVGLINSGVKCFYSLVNGGKESSRNTHVCCSVTCPFYRSNICHKSAKFPCLPINSRE